MKVKYLILGAGPAGLTFANTLLRNKETSFLVLEQKEEAGGLCRSKTVDGSELDIGGGHFLDVRRPEVLEYVFDFMPKEEWNRYDRDSRIKIHDTYVGHPFEANIWQLNEALQTTYLESIKEAGCNNGQKKPTRFTEWIEWKLGKEIAKNYMLPYNTKMYGEELDELGTYWLEKLPNVSYEETLQSCKEHRAYGTQPGHAQFFYPKQYGFGEVFRRMAERLGERILYNTPVRKLDMVSKKVNEMYEADYIITTIPWTGIEEINGFSADTRQLFQLLKHTSVTVDYFKEQLDTPAQWIYYPDLDVFYHRILVRHNFMEKSKGYWTETNTQRRNLYQVDSEYSYVNEYAYPLNTIGKNEAMATILGEAQKYDVYGLGRWGEWQHYNADVVMEKSLTFARKFLF